jgi:hypothetical protein
MDLRSSVYRKGWAWQHLRATRAEPPPLVRSDSERIRVFDAALEQAEQLCAAAEVTSPATAPIPLFYALSQAGRAIAAAALTEDWQPRGHGLSIPPSDALIPERPITIRPSSKRMDSFAAVAKALQAPDLEGDVELGAVWAAIPELRWSAPPVRHSRALELVAEFDDPAGEYSKLANPAVHIVYLEATSDLTDQGSLKARLASYPTIRHGEGVPLPDNHTLPLHPVPGFGFFPQVRATGSATDVRQAAAELDRIAAKYGPDGKRYVLPALSINEDWEPAPILLWWILLYALSSLARYEPALWGRAIDVSSSPLAVPIEMVCESALEALPRLVLSALVGYPLSAGLVARGR